MGLGEKADVRVKTLSGGQLRRLDVGLGIIGDPELLFLDEPTTGFDPTARRSAWSSTALSPSTAVTGSSPTVTPGGRWKRMRAAAGPRPPMVSGVPSATITPALMTATRSARLCASSM